MNQTKKRNSFLPIKNEEFPDFTRQNIWRKNFAKNFVVFDFQCDSTMREWYQFNMDLILHSAQSIVIRSLSSLSKIESKQFNE